MTVSENCEYKNIGAKFTAKCQKRNPIYPEIFKFMLGLLGRKCDPNKPM